MSSHEFSQNHQDIAAETNPNNFSYPAGIPQQVFGSHVSTSVPTNASGANIRSQSDNPLLEGGRLRESGMTLAQYSQVSHDDQLGNSRSAQTGPGIGQSQPLSTHQIVNPCQGQPQQPHQVEHNPAGSQSQGWPWPWPKPVRIYTGNITDLEAFQEAKNARPRWSLGLDETKYPQIVTELSEIANCAYDAILQVDNVIDAPVNYGRGKPSRPATAVQNIQDGYWSPDLVRRAAWKITVDCYDVAGGAYVGAIIKKDGALKHSITVRRYPNFVKRFAAIHKSLWCEKKVCKMWLDIDYNNPQQQFVADPQGFSDKKATQQKNNDHRKKAKTNTNENEAAELIPTNDEIQHTNNRKRLQPRSNLDTASKKQKSGVNSTRSSAASANTVSDSEHSYRVPTEFQGFSLHEREPFNSSGNYSTPGPRPSPRSSSHFGETLDQAANSHRSFSNFSTTHPQHQGQVLSASSQIVLAPSTELGTRVIPQQSRFPPNHPQSLSFQSQSRSDRSDQRVSGSPIQIGIQPNRRPLQALPRGSSQVSSLQGPRGQPQQLVPRPVQYSHQELDRQQQTRPPPARPVQQLQTNNQPAPVTRTEQPARSSINTQEPLERQHFSSMHEGLHSQINAQPPNYSSYHAASAMMPQSTQNRPSPVQIELTEVDSINQPLENLEDPSSQNVDQVNNVRQHSPLKLESQYDGLTQIWRAGRPLYQTLLNALVESYRTLSDELAGREKSSTTAVVQNSAGHSGSLSLEMQHQRLGNVFNVTVPPPYDTVFNELARLYQTFSNELALRGHPDAVAFMANNPSADGSGFSVTNLIPQIPQGTSESFDDDYFDDSEDDY